MAERNSEYERSEDYATPDWVTQALLSVETFNDPIWEVAPGSGYMVRSLEWTHAVVTAWPDFLETGGEFPMFSSIITNPPYKHADAFVRRALACAKAVDGKVAMLLPMAFDAANGRRDIFKNCPAFKTKYVITKRIRWANIEQKAAGPSMNHAWFVWDWKRSGPATIGYLPLGAE